MRQYSKHDKQWIVRAFVLALLDVLFVASGYFLALMLRFDFVFSHIDQKALAGYRQLILPYCISVVVIFYLFRLYHSIWRFASVSELERMVLAWVVFQLVVLVIYFITDIRMPMSFWAGGALIGFLLTTSVRFSYRFLRGVRGALEQRQGSVTGNERVMVIGAGESGRGIIHEYIMSRYLNARVCCVIDDNPVKKGRYLDGVPIVGGRQEIRRCVEEYEITTIIFAIPTASGIEKKEILDICGDTGCKVKVIPGIYQLVDGKVSVSQLRDVQIEDLLGRDPVQVNNDEVHRYIHGKVVMVTGGGGSIGSELCRQVAKDEPEQLIIFDIYENNAYDIQQELKRKYPGLNLVTLIGSVRNTNRVNYVLKRYRPELIIHAAAHKHVPLMEDSPDEAIKNNVGGTWKLSEAAIRYGVKRFVMISTDKAVNPTNVMGATKRICEMIVQMMNRRAGGKTTFTAVRFGNVLGSNGSVIPLFRQQIAQGGPVTVTDKRIIRYFMTIPEAVSLVLQSAYYAKGGEIFVLDMGQPVKIDDMARNLIRLSGFTPDVDIKVVYTGLRPGEKLYEELLMGAEGLQDTPNRLIHIAEPIEMDDRVFEKKVLHLVEEAREEREDPRSLIADIIPTYHPGSVGDLKSVELAGVEADSSRFRPAGGPSAPL